ncbi:endochitinase A-like [Pseudomyrmex gracilis]|uniref:endochitinase A-like n=1 Tax=Pseudomyrmex gracilis TaxID=219809 RepID=UPI000995650D|nr:endochitinase A-like [Pseudomyrmex gracilis]
MSNVFVTLLLFVVVGSILALVFTRVICGNKNDAERRLNGYVSVLKRKRAREAERKERERRDKDKHGQSSEDDDDNEDPNDVSKLDDAGAYGEHGRTVSPTPNLSRVYVVAPKLILSDNDAFDNNASGNDAYGSDALNSRRRDASAFSDATAKEPDVTANSILSNATNSNEFALNVSASSKDPNGAYATNLYRSSGRSRNANNAENPHTIEIADRTVPLKKLSRNAKENPLYVKPDAVAKRYFAIDAQREELERERRRNEESERERRREAEDNERRKRERVVADKISAISGAEAMMMADDPSAYNLDDSPSAGTTIGPTDRVLSRRKRARSDVSTQSSKRRIVDKCSTACTCDKCEACRGDDDSSAPRAADASNVDSVSVTRSSASTDRTNNDVDDKSGNENEDDVEPLSTTGITVRFADEMEFANRAVLTNATNDSIATVSDTGAQSSAASIEPLTKSPTSINNVRGRSNGVDVATTLDRNEPTIANGSFPRIESISENDAARCAACKHDAKLCTCDKFDKLGTPSPPVASASATPVAPSSATPVAPSSATPVAPSSATPVAPSSAPPVASASATPVASASATPVAPSSATPVAPSSANISERQRMLEEYEEQRRKMERLLEQEALEEQRYRESLKRRDLSRGAKVETGENSNASPIASNDFTMDSQLTSVATAVSKVDSTKQPVVVTEDTVALGGYIEPIVSQGTARSDTDSTANTDNTDRSVFTSEATIVANRAIEDKESAASEAAIVADRAIDDKASVPNGIEVESTVSEATMGSGTSDFARSLEVDKSIESNASNEATVASVHRGNNDVAVTETSVDSENTAAAIETSVDSENTAASIETSVDSENTAASSGSNESTPSFVNDNTTSDRDAVNAAVEGTTVSSEFTPVESLDARDVRSEQPANIAPMSPFEDAAAPVVPRKKRRVKRSSEL